MTAQDIQSALDLIPSDLKDVHPKDIQNYFKTTYPELTENEVKLLVANYVYGNIPLGTDVKSAKSWRDLRPSIINKYSNLSDYDIQADLNPWVRLVHAQADSGLVITVVQ